MKEVGVGVGIAAHASALSQFYWVIEQTWGSPAMDLHLRILMQKDEDPNL